MKNKIKTILIVVIAVLLFGVAKASIVEDLLLDPSTSGYMQNNSECSFDGSNFLVVWQDNRSDISDIYGALVFPGGLVQNPGVFPISVAYSSQSHPCVSFDGSNYLIAWDDQRFEHYQITSWMFLTLVTPNGTVLYPDGVPIWDTTHLARLTNLGDVVYGGAYHLLVWSVLDDQMRLIGVRGARILTANGIIQTVDPLDGFLIDIGYSGRPACAFDGNNYFVVYNKATFGILGSRITQQAEVLDHIQITSSGNFPDVCFGSNNYLVVWQDNSDIYGARVNPDGTVLDPDGILIVSQAGEQSNPKVAFDGSHWIVIWEDVPSSNIYGRKVSLDGSLGPVFPVSDANELQCEPAICHGPADLICVPFTGWYSQANNDRIWVKFLGDHVLWTNNWLSLAYNGNRHLARKPNSEELHLVYTNADVIVYRYSADGGANWTLPVNIGNGEFPALDLDSQGNPCVTWTNGNTLYFSRKDPLQGWQTAQYTFGTNQPSHPCLTVTTYEQTNVDSAHILVRLYNAFFSTNTITEVRFQVTTPQSYGTITVEQSLGANMITLDYPAIADDYTNILHATWMHGDTIYYGVRAQSQSRWDV